MKKVSLTRQLKAANERILILEKQIEEHEKKLKTAEGNRDYYSKQSSDRQAEIEGMHTLLDALPLPPPSKTTADYPRDLNIATRLAAWLASRP